MKAHKAGVRCTYRNHVAMNYKSAFTQSTFCLVAKTERLFQINLIESLASNCIPVIWADNIVLPFSEVCITNIRINKMDNKINAAYFSI